MVHAERHHTRGLVADGAERPREVLDGLQQRRRLRVLEHAAAEQQGLALGVAHALHRRGHRRTGHTGLGLDALGRPARERTLERLERRGDLARHVRRHAGDRAPTW
jgi:hypothetical protein